MLTSSSSSAMQTKCPFHSNGVLQQLTVKEKIDKDEVVNIITDLFLGAADTVSDKKKRNFTSLSPVGKIKVSVSLFFSFLLSLKLVIQDLLLPSLLHHRLLLSHHFLLFSFFTFL